MRTRTNDPGIPPRTADEALASLQAGNLRFVRGEARFPAVQKEILAELARGSSPVSRSWAPCSMPRCICTPCCSW